MSDRKLIWRDDVVVWLMPDGAHYGITPADVELINSLLTRPGYVPLDKVDEVNALLSSIYGDLWCQAYYDPDNEKTQAFAKPLADKMTALNKIMKFKR